MSKEYVKNLIHDDILGPPPPEFTSDTTTKLIDISSISRSAFIIDKMKPDNSIK